YDEKISSKDIDSSLTAEKGTEVWIAIVAQNAKNLDTYQVEIEYDTKRAQFIQGVEDNSFGGIKNFLKKNGGTTVGFKAQEIDSGTVNIANALSGQDMDQAPEGSGIIALVQFKILNNFPDNFLKLINVNFLNSKELEDNVHHLMNAVFNPNENSPPTITDISDLSIDEDTQTSSILFSIDDIDGNDLTIKTFSSNSKLVPNTPENIILSGSGKNRKLQIIPLGNQSGSASITVEVSDGKATAEGSFDLTVNPINDPPAISYIKHQDTNKNTKTDPISFSINDVDHPIEELKLSASSSNSRLVPNENIIISGSNNKRTIVITPANGQSGTSEITLSVSDGISKTTQSFNIVVDDLLLSITKYSEASIGMTFKKQLTLTNQNKTLVESIDAIMNYDSQNLRVLNVSLQDGALDGKEYSLDIGNYPDGQLIMIFSADKNLIPVQGTFASIEFEVVGTKNNTSDLTFSYVQINELDISSSSGKFRVNLPPEISDIEDQKININTSTSAIPLSINDEYLSSENLLLKGQSSNPSLVPVENIIFNGSGDKKTVTISPLTGKSGVSTITIVVNDGNAQATTSFELTVNSLPVAKSDTTSLPEDSISFPITLTGSDLENNSIKFSVVTQPKHGELKGLAPFLTYTPAKEYYGLDSFTFIANDGFADSEIAVIDIQVKPENDLPTISGLQQIISSNMNIPVSVNFI
ncbi:hypothetical protein MHK_006163, partial [Candidatus Magnetomorum sp. HK-1]